MIIQKLWGYEKTIVNNNLYCGKILTVIPNGMACSVHYHKKKTETFYVTKGQLEVQLCNMEGVMLRQLTLHMGQSLTVPAMTPHRFWTDEEICEFVEFSTQDEPSDSYRIVNSGPQPVV